ncbi:unnamed protein product [Ilex paraguariensis]|uniref:Uncharacterized protein n=1 Tax=Ilex paraguariensis TaxID=185542 RepID=A0ABC8R9G6_9AQUA
MGLTTLCYCIFCLIFLTAGELQQTLEAFVAIAAVSQFLYLVLLHSGMFNSRYGPAYRSYDYEAPGDTGMAHEPGRSGTAAEYETITNEPARFGIASEYEATGMTHEPDERFDAEYEATGITHEPDSSGTAAVVYK